MSADPRNAGPERAAADSAPAQSPRTDGPVRADAVARAPAPDSSAATRRRVCLILLLAVLVAAGFLWWRQRQVDLNE